MDMYTNQHSPLTDEDVPSLHTVTQALRSIKIESMSVWHTDPRPYTPNVIDSFANSNDDYGCPGSVTYMSLTPAEIESAGPSTPFPLTADILNYDYKPTFYRMEQTDVLLSDIKDEGYVSPSRSFHSLTPPAQPYGHLMPDSANESGNSNEYSGIHEAEDVPQLQQFRLAEPVQSPQPPRTQCVKCGILVVIGQCLKEASGHYLCYTCRIHTEPYDQHVAQSEEPEEALPKRCKKRLSAAANARHNICSNCECISSTLWRRDCQGQTVCNSCGLYEKLHGKKRPKHMRKDTIQTRKRKPRNTDCKKKSTTAATASTSRAAVAVPVTVSLPPPPPYDRYAATQDPANYQLLPPMGNNNGFFGNYHADVLYHHYPGSSMN